jgi:hypothetical protein
MGEVVDLTGAIWPASSFPGNTPSFLPCFDAPFGGFLANLPKFRS